MELARLFLCKTQYSLYKSESFKYCHLRRSISYSYLKITQTDFSKAEAERLVKDVKEILMKNYKKRFVKNEMERYLRVYTMRTSNPKVTYKDIAKKEFPGDNASEEIRRRALITDFNKAKKIIKNIEDNVQIWW